MNSNTFDSVLKRSCHSNPNSNTILLSFREFFLLNFFMHVAFWKFFSSWNWAVFLFLLEDHGTAFKSLPVFSQIHTGIRCIFAKPNTKGVRGMDVMEQDQVGEWKAHEVHLERNRKSTYQPQHFENHSQGVCLPIASTGRSTTITSSSTLYYLWKGDRISCEVTTQKGQLLDWESIRFL